MSAALPQVYASEEELARSDALRSTAAAEQFGQHTQQQYQQTQNGFSNSHNGYDEEQEQQQRYSPAGTQQQYQQSARQYTPQQQQQQPQSARQQQGFERSVQRPQVGVASVPKLSQSHWQTVLQRGPASYQGTSVFAHHMASHLPTSVPASGHADGPQHVQYPPGATLPDAPHRQAWSNQPT